MLINYCGKMEENKKQEIMIRLNKLIAGNLEFCDEESTPYICNLKQSKSGHKEIEEFVIKCFFETKLSVSEALTMKENELNPNYLTD
tara:strand:- start:1015 stop:1275 length:261 start_codon:yes stop_codon:yes gene_type:complete